MGTVVGEWRLKSIIGILVFISLMYSSYAIFSPSLIAEQSGGFINEEGYVEYNNTINNTLAYNQTDVNIQGSQSFIDVIVGIGKFLTFADIDNVWASTILTLVVSICWIIIGYIIYTFFKEWIPLT